MKKTKILAAVMALCLAIGAAGCGQPASQSTAAASTASQQQTDTVVVAMNVESEPASGLTRRMAGVRASMCMSR